MDLYQTQDQITPKEAVHKGFPISSKKENQKVIFNPFVLVIQFLEKSDWELPFLYLFYSSIKRSHTMKEWGSNLVGLCDI